MPSETRARLLSLVRHTDADPVEVALLCAAVADRSSDVEVSGLRVDALADGLRVDGVDPGDAAGTATALRRHLADAHGFTGDGTLAADPRGSLLPAVLDTKRGLALTLAALYAGLGRRVGARTFTIALPGHAIVGVADSGRPVLLDPFNGGRLLDEAAAARCVAAATEGRTAFHRAMLRPTSAQQFARRLLHELAVACAASDQPRAAVRCGEALLVLPGASARDHHEQGERLTAIGRFDLAAAAHEAAWADGTADGELRETAHTAAVQARARMN